MFIWSIPKLFGRLAVKFARADQGNIAVVFAIAMVPVIGFVGAAVDYSRANSARSAMQVALDSAALMVSKDIATGAITSSQVASKAQAYFNALYTDTSAGSVTVTAAYTASTTAGSTIQLTGSSTVATQFMKAVGIGQLGIGSSSTTSWGTTKMRVAMALDNTGSMNDNGKLPALKTSAKSLVDQLSALATNNGDVYISVIPFAKDVNIGASNYTQNWIDWTDWEAEAPDLVGTANKPSNWSLIGPGSTCPWTMKTNGFTCLSGPASTTAVSTVPSSGTYTGYICPGPDASQNRYGYAYHYLINGCYTSTASTSTVSSGSNASCGSTSNCTCSGNGSSKVCKQTTYTHAWTPNNHNTWSGCLADRTQSYDITNAAPTGATATLFPAEQYYENWQSYCASSNSTVLQAATPLSYNWTTIKANIDAMQATGGTNQPIGLAQAWHTLAQTAPYNAPAEDSNYTYAKSIIILSDGLNTENRWPAYGDGSTQNGTMIDDRQKILCDNIKAAGITIYTVQVNTSTPADPTSAVLKYCASGSSNFYLVTAASQTAAVFTSIGNSLTQLRVSK